MRLQQQGSQKTSYTKTVENNPIIYLLCHLCFQRIEQYTAHWTVFMKPTLYSLDILTQFEKKKKISLYNIAAVLLHESQTTKLFSFLCLKQ